MGKLTTHVLDTASGRPANDVKLELYQLDGDSRSLLKTVLTNKDGRCDQPLLEDQEFHAKEYEIVFYAGDYFARYQQLPEPRFVDKVSIRFGIANAEQHYHVPLLVSPYSYSTYRGS